MKRPKIINNKFCSLKYQITLLTTFIFILIFSTAFFGCKDNPVTPIHNNQPKVIDTSMYDWQFVPFNAYGTSNEYEIYAADTNKVFITSQPGTFFYDGNAFTLIDQNTPDFIVEYIDGINEDNVYLGGGGTAQFTTHARLKKWNGSSAQEIQMPANDSAKYGEYIFAHSLNDIWIATNCNIVYKFDGINTVNTYYLPVTGHFNISTIFIDSNNEILLYGSKLLNSNYINYGFKYVNDNWTIIYSDTNLREGGFVVGSDLLGYDNKYIYYFTPDGWHQLLEMNGFESPFPFAGISKDDFLCNANRAGIGTDDMYFYKNGKVYHDTAYKPPGLYQDTNLNSLKLVKNIYFGIFEQSSDYLIIGRPQSKSKK